MPTQRAAFIFFLTLLLFAAGRYSYAQRLASFDSFPSIHTLVKQQLDSVTFQPGKTLPSLKPGSANGLLPSFSMKQYNPFKNIKDSSGKVKVKFQGGFISYNMGYRSLIDTPLMEKDILQHTINGNANVAVGYFPLQVNYLVRKTNSAFFRDLVDIQVNLDVQKFQQNMVRGALDNLNKKIASLQDEATGALSKIMLDKYLHLQKDFSTGFNAQKLTEARQMLNIPELSIDKSLPDSQARVKSDSLRAIAADYIKLYGEYEGKLAAVKSVADSLKTQYASSVKKVNQLKQLLKGNIPDLQVLKKLAQDSLVKNSGIRLLPEKYQWLLGIRKLNLGRTPVNYSDLTAKNLSLNGINFEYNSRFYFALTAGLVNYRFRDFNIRSAGRPKQYFVMSRFGVGTLNKSYIIASVFNGTKQIFASGYIGNLYTVRTTGMSLEARYQLNRYNYLKAEIAQTFAPDFRNNPPEKSKWTLSDKTNKAYMIGGHFESRKLQAKLDGSYKYTGANFQSFSNFQTNAAQHIWNIKAEKYFFRKHLRLNGAVKSNEFTNPYLIQSYSNNTVFKSLQATFRKKKWPTVSAGYMPMTQLSDINGMLTENRFNSINANIYHKYNLGRLKTATSIVFSRFYNNSSDSGFIYFNAKNILVSQQFYFPSYTANINYYRSSNNAYKLNVMEESFLVPLKKQNTILVGAKIYNLERVENKVGVYGNIQFAAGRAMQLRIQWEEGYIPGINGNLVKNRIGNIQLTKNL